MTLARCANSSYIIASIGRARARYTPDVPFGGVPSARVSCTQWAGALLSASGAGAPRSLSRETRTSLPMTRGDWLCAPRLSGLILHRRHLLRCLWVIDSGFMEFCAKFRRKYTWWFRLLYGTEGGALAYVRILLEGWRIDLGGKVSPVCWRVPIPRVLLRENGNAMEFWFYGSFLKSVTCIQI